MFKPRTTRHRQQIATVHRARLGRGTSRRLDVETMEGRLMLAVSALEFAPVELPVAQFSVGGEQVNSPSGPAVWVATLGDEGGFITNQFSLADATRDSSAVLLGSGLAGDSLNELIHNSASAASNSDGTTLSWVQFRELHLVGGGLQPVAIFVAQDNADVTRALESIFASYNGSHGDLDEGGTISIPAILASKELVRGSELDQKVGVKSLAAEVSSESDQPSRLAAAPSAHSAISGEWARAMVFEMAGGEPEAGGQSATRDRGDRSSKSAVDPSPQVGEPLSSVPAHRAAEQDVAQRTGAARIRDAAVEVKSAALQADESSRLSGTMVGGFDSLAGAGNVAVGQSGSGSLASTAHSAGNLGGRAGQATMAANLPETPFEKAFEQIGSSAKAVIQSLADDSWHRSLGAAPLLMVLALERIAAGNSRRANRDAAAVATCRPRRKRDMLVNTPNSPSREREE